MVLAICCNIKPWSNDLDVGWCTHSLTSIQSSIHFRCVWNWAIPLLQKAIRILWGTWCESLGIWGSLFSDKPIFVWYIYTVGGNITNRNDMGTRKTRKTAARWTSQDIHKSYQEKPRNLNFNIFVQEMRNITKHLYLATFNAFNTTLAIVILGLAGRHFNAPFFVLSRPPDNPKIGKMMMQMAVVPVGPWPLLLGFPH